MILHKSILKTLNKTRQVPNTDASGEMSFYKVPYQGNGYNELTIKFHFKQYTIISNTKRFDMGPYYLYKNMMKCMNPVEELRRLSLIYKMCKPIYKYNDTL